MYELAKLTVVIDYMNAKIEQLKWELVNLSIQVLKYKFWKYNQTKWGKTCMASKEQIPLRANYTNAIGLQ